MIHQLKINAIVIATLAIACTKAPHKDKAKEDAKEKDKTIVTPRGGINPNIPKVNPQKVISELQTEIKSMYRTPKLTLILIPEKDIQQSISNLIEKGGKLIYDPNFREGNDIPFYLAELTPDQINNTKFMLSLNLKSASLDKVQKHTIPTNRLEINSSIKPTNFIPTDSVGLFNFPPEQRNQLGAGVTVAVIDTGIDASHPAFTNRVDYWFDATEETKIPLVLKNISEEGKVNYKNKSIDLSQFKGEEVYLGSFNEKEFFFQLNDDNKSKKGFLDLNYNKTADTFLILITKTNDQYKSYVDTNGDFKFSKKELSFPLIDYNLTSEINRKKGMVSFPTRNNIIKYPLLLTKEGDKLYAGLGKTSGMHGTHVAGIIAADDPKNNLVGVAPKAKLMSLRVCSQISCTDSAIIKALYKAFYNGKIIPDVVNISLGSHEGYKRGLYSHIFNDLSAKFGSIFFISASNSGPGFRSLNHLGNSGAVVTVGANVSAQTLKDQYNLPDDAPVLNEQLLFFSSLGPSYTGEMKPNIVAPGGAISTVLAAEGYMSQANGTSMSSPLAAGVMAAVISSSMHEAPDLFKQIKNTRLLRKKDESTVQETLQPYVYAMRDSLMLSAKRVPNLSMAQQGFGLIKAFKAKEKLITLLNEINAGEKKYFEVVINNYEKGGYKRGIQQSETNSFTLSLGKDGERSKIETAYLISQGVKVQLDRVEEISPQGKVKFHSKMEDFFYIIDLGNAQKKARETKVVFNNRRNTTFFSKRVLSKMKPGFTYLAHYKIFAGTANVQNILDVVSIPMKFKNHKISLDSLNPNKNKYTDSIVVKNEKIGINQFHRYPFLVDAHTRGLKLSMAMKRSMPGKLFIQVYDPDGKELVFKVVNNTPINGYSQLKLDLTTLKKGKINQGIWEVTVSTSSHSWLSDTEFDMALKQIKFGIKESDLSIAKKEMSKSFMASLQNTKIEKFEITNSRLAKIEKVKVKTNHYSFHPITFPNKEAKFKIKLSLDKKIENYWGRIDHRLFVKEGDDFKEVKVKVENKDDFKIFSGIKDAGKNYYFALDTIQNYDNGKGMKESQLDQTNIFVEFLEYKFPKDTFKISLSNYMLNFVAQIDITKNKTLTKHNLTDFLVMSDLILIDEEKQKQKTPLKVHY
ncbi:S8 family serine peptidase [Bacteriovoracaceae bacterium]|nr:S8 family serine peptidase [Bacteriovoracaceae bacterium]